MAVKRQILVVGDAQTFVRFMTVLLVRMGYEVISAENGDEALRLAELFRPDIITLDMDALAATGTETLLKMKRDALLSDIPVIIISGTGHEKLKKACISLGYTRHIAKPVNPSELNKALQNFLFVPQGWARKHLRTGCDARVSISHEGVVQVYQAQTISEHGIFVVAAAPLHKGTEVKVTMRVGGTSISPTGRVIYIKPPGMAIEFSQIAQDEQAELEKFVSNLLAGDIAPLQEARALQP